MGNLTNLLEETVDILRDNGKDLEDAIWIGSKDGYITLETFKKLADVEYYGGFGGHEVASDLVVIGEDWYLTRGEYDGSEWWDYHSMEMFEKPSEELEIKSLIGNSWDTLKTIGEEL